MPEPAVPDARIPPDDPEEEFAPQEGEMPITSGPRIINVGIPGPGLIVVLDKLRQL